jgi:hypothetical protein
MNLFVGRPFQAVVAANTADFDALKRASYIFFNLKAKVGNQQSE